MSGQECGVFKAMMLLSLPPRGRCKQWEQTGIQTLGKGSQRLGLTPRGSKRVTIHLCLDLVSSVILTVPHSQIRNLSSLRRGLHAWELGRRKDPVGEGIGCSPWPRLALALGAALPNRLVGARWLTTFFCGWKRMMCSLGAKRQPSTTEPLRLTDTHIVVVCTWRDVSAGVNEGQGRSGRHSTCLGPGLGLGLGDPCLGGGREGW